jgi:protein-L-isoaspartate(D-aspartate) O-methyltransferase
MIDNFQQILTKFKEPNTELLFKMLESMNVSELLNDPRVIQAMRKIRIEDFITEDMIISILPPDRKLDGIIKEEDIIGVLAELFTYFYKNRPLMFYRDRTPSLDLTRTTGAPHMIAIIAQLLDIEENDKILILGSKSGYMESIIQDIEKNTEAYVIERVPEIYEITKSNIDRIQGETKIYLGDPIYYIKNLPVKQFDKILITGFIKSIPKEVFNHLKIGGILLAPVGSFYHQDFLRYFKTGVESWDEETHLAVMFSRLVTKYQN